MSKYTTEVRFICESMCDPDVKDKKIIDKLTNVAPKIFDFDFPIFDEAYRLPLEIKILKHFYTREIGLETYGLWKLKLDDKLNEIMPYLNRFYSVYVKDVNPLYNMDYTKHNKADNKRTNSGEDNIHAKTDFYGKDTSDDKRLYSDTPQGELTDVQNGKYLTNATFDGGVNEREGYTEGDNTTTHGHVITDDNEYYDTVQGINGKFVGEAWKAFREGFVNVDKMLFKELEVLFMQLW